MQYCTICNRWQPKRWLRVLHALLVGQKTYFHLIGVQFSIRLTTEGAKLSIFYATFYQNASDCTKATLILNNPVIFNHWVIELDLQTVKLPNLSVGRMTSNPIPKISQGCIVEIISVITSNYGCSINIIHICNL
jgi:hypothetical protein